MVVKIISGGQTGADRAALDVARELGLASGGWVPRGRRAEDGAIPPRYQGLVETDSGAYECRTELNVRDADATVIFTFGPLTGGSALTATLAQSLGKPVLTLDLERAAEDQAVAELCRWIGQTHPRILNVAGPRLSAEPRIAEATASVLRQALRPADQEG